MNLATMTGPGAIRQIVRIQEALDAARNEALEQAAKHVEERVGVRVGYGLRIVSSAELAAELRAMKRGRT